MKHTQNVGKILSKAELKKTVGGSIDEGLCTESCGTATNNVTCSSTEGSCSRDTASPCKWIKCDGKQYDCP